MSSFRVTIFELKPRSANAEPMIPPVAFDEVKVFEQIVPDIDVRRFARDFNKPVRVRRSRAAA